MKKRLNIAIFTDQYFPQISGVVTSTLTLKENLQKLGHQVTIVTVQHPQAKEDEPGIIRIPSMVFPPLPTQRVASVHSTRAMKKLTALNLDIIHTQTEFSMHIFAQHVSRKFNIPIVHTYHTMYLDYLHYISPDKMIPFTSRVVTRLIKSINDKAEIVITPTAKSKEHLLECDVESPIQIVPTGIDLSRFTPETQDQAQLKEARKELGISKEDNVLLFIGRIAKEKSIDVLLESLPPILEENPGTKLLIVGDGPERENLEFIAEELNIQNNVIFAGEKSWDQIGIYYNLGDLFLSASTSETQGLTFLEAMAANLPVIARFDGSLELIISEGETGFFFGDASQLSSITNFILKNKTLHNRMKEGAGQMAEEYSCMNFAKKVEEIYKQTLKQFMPAQQRIRFPERIRRTFSRAS